MVEFFLNDYKDASLFRILLEFAAFACGILSVWFARKENIWVYPTGLIATIITAYLLYFAGYYGDMTINVYFSIMSFYGWFRWSKKQQNDTILPITRTNLREKIIGIMLFFLTIVIVVIIYKYFNRPMQIDNYIDIFASGIFFTAMWYMALKKIENWILWIIGDIIVTPLYAYRGLGMLSLQYLIFTILAIAAYLEWKRNLNSKLQTL